jgi:hypothetical protein
MKLDRAEITHNEVVGRDHRGDPVHHIKTLGGAHFFISISPYGEVTVLSTAAHRAIGKNQAESRANIDWDQSSNLFKSEAMSVHAPPVESNPTNHFRQAAYFSKRFGKVKKTPNPTFEDKLLMVMLQESALNHYKMMGDDDERAKRNHDIQSHYHSEVGEDYNPPFDNEALVNAFEAKQAAAPNVSKSEEPLEKDRGRITFPADPKITDRPDQEVTQIHDDRQLKVRDKLADNSSRGTLTSKVRDSGAEITDKVNRMISDVVSRKAGFAGVNQTRRYSGITEYPAVSSMDERNKTHESNAINEHEGFHNLVAKITNKHGSQVGQDFVDHLYNSISPESKSFISSFIKGRGYDDNDPNFKEEVIAHIRDLGHIPKDREDYKKHHGLSDDDMREHMRRINKDWNVALKVSNGFNLGKSESESSVSDLVVEFIIEDTVSLITLLSSRK